MNDVKANQNEITIDLSNFIKFVLDFKLKILFVILLITLAFTFTFFNKKLYQYEANLYIIPNVYNYGDNQSSFSNSAITKDYATILKSSSIIDSVSEKNKNLKINEDIFIETAVQDESWIINILVSSKKK